MSIEEILLKLKNYKEKGLTYKFLANQINIKPQSIYNYIKAPEKYKTIHNKLEEYFRKEKC